MYKKELSTMSGMWALWDYETYKDVNDYDKWEPLFCDDEDILRQIMQNSFVPVYISEDGCRSFVLKVDEELNEREKQYTVASSDEYFFHSNGKVVLSGIDSIDTNINNDVMEINLPEGNYSVSVYLLAWDEELGAYLENGEVSPNALPDFVLIVNSNADSNKEYRKRIDTFSEDDIVS